METGGRWESTPFGYPVVDKPWAGLLAPAAAPLKVDPDQLEVRQLEICEWEESVWEDVESGMDSDEVGVPIYVGRRMETDVGNGPRGVQTNWSNIMATSIEGDVISDKVISPAARLEGKFGEGVGETNVDKPVIIPLPQ